jgi:prolyl-tRNA editing enzyme YbaK/EbsC (Cys-tRNA(Pro) deacylase)
MEAAKLSPSAQRVQDVLRNQGYANEVVEMPQTTRTSKEAAAAIGCSVAQIAKSLIFRGKDSGRPYLVIASGPNRVNEGAIAERVGEAIEKPDADYVVAQTGYVIGGVAPLGHTQKMPTFIDADLLKYETIWAAAGDPFAVFQLTPDELVRMTSGEVVSVK